MLVLTARLLLQDHGHHRGPDSSVLYQLSPPWPAGAVWHAEAFISECKVYLLKWISFWGQVVCVCADCGPVWRRCGGLLRYLWWRPQWGSASAAAVHHGRCAVWGASALQYRQCVHVQHFPHLTQVGQIFCESSLNVFVSRSCTDCCV